MWTSRDRVNDVFKGDSWKIASLQGSNAQWSIRPSKEIFQLSQWFIFQDCSGWKYDLYCVGRQNSGILEKAAQWYPCVIDCRLSWAPETLFRAWKDRTPIPLGSRTPLELYTQIWATGPLVTIWESEKVYLCVCAFCQLILSDRAHSHSYI